jgi:hypothetical protein
VYKTGDCGITCFGVLLKGYVQKKFSLSMEGMSSTIWNGWREVMNIKLPTFFSRNLASGGGLNLVIGKIIKED